MNAQRALETDGREPIVTLAEALPREMLRVSVLVAIYESMPMGFLAAALMRADLERAVLAMASYDVVQMLGVYDSLKGYSE